jgi:hypothetical protein
VMGAAGDTDAFRMQVDGMAESARAQLAEI